MNLINKDIEIEFFYNPERVDEGTYVVKFTNVVFFIESGFIIVEEEKDNGTLGIPFPLKTIKKYKHKTHVS